MSIFEIRYKELGKFIVKTMTTDFFSKISNKKFILNGASHLKQIKSTFLSDSLNYQFKVSIIAYQNMKSDVYRKLSLQPNLIVQRLKQKFRGKETFFNLLYR